MKEIINSFYDVIPYNSTLSKSDFIKSIINNYGSKNKCVNDAIFAIQNSKLISVTNTKNSISFNIA